MDPLVKFFPNSGNRIALHGAKVAYENEIWSSFCKVTFRCLDIGYNISFHDQQFVKEFKVKIRVILG